MIIASLQHIKHSFGEGPILNDISTEIHDGDCVGLIGANGSGKSTLMRMLTQEIYPDEGRVSWKKGSRIGYLRQIPAEAYEEHVRSILYQPFSRLMDIAEHLRLLETKMTEGIATKKEFEQYGEDLEAFARHGGYEMDAQIEDVTNGLGINEWLDASWHSLSGGEKTKVGLALILLKDPDLFLLDEPTNHLDIGAVEWLSQYLQQFKGAVVVISHDRYFLDDVVTNIIEIENGDLHAYETNYSDYLTERENRLLREFKTYEDQQKKIKKMKETIKRLKIWANQANPPNDGLHRRAKSMEKALNRMEMVKAPAKNKSFSVDLKRADRSGNDVVMLEAVHKAFDDHSLLTNVNMHIRFQGRAAIIGNNGTGKTTLLKMMLGDIKADKGEVKLGSQVRVGYLSQHVFVGDENSTVIDAFRSRVNVAEADARHILAQFLFYGNHVFKKVAMLSGGERVRLRLAQLTNEQVNTLVLDEPTNHLDIASREVIEETINDFSGTVIAITHDRYFLNQFSQLYWIDDQTVYYYEGNYDWAKKKHERRHL
ncbi:ABC-F type ribosomal protection protein [Salicibibacter cibi]|uniref:ABC-F type ribosomal protection protein n=1 Tax=Salicibibacter cibi TaxID=2743001 RepID=A0A7T7CEQ5_9BACI|nr:ABC-F type ribosomal protection protein [Salicibibacter cibi]QQK79292.1 ABC-F type ribosomal protection protein [Salicibibacter cibi]